LHKLASNPPLHNEMENGVQRFFSKLKRAGEGKELLKNCYKISDAENENKKKPVAREKIAQKRERATKEAKKK
jgi:hypothetical protein